MAQALFYLLLNNYLHVTVLLGIIKQITHGSEGNTSVDMIFLGLIICTVTLTAMRYLYSVTRVKCTGGVFIYCPINARCANKATCNYAGYANYRRHSIQKAIKLSY